MFQDLVLVYISAHLEDYEVIDMHIRLFISFTSLTTCPHIVWTRAVCFQLCNSVERGDDGDDVMTGEVVEKRS